jgi:hypothetical protein
MVSAKEADARHHIRSHTQNCVTSNPHTFVSKPMKEKRQSVSVNEEW